MKKLLFIVFLLVATNAFAITKSTETVDNWTDVKVNTVIEGATANISPNYQTTLQIDAAAGVATATTNGLKIIVQSSSATSGDDKWAELTSFSMLAGVTANLEPISNNPLAAGSTTITCADTTGYVTEGSLAFASEPVATLTNSELLFITTFVTNVSITVLDGTTYSHVQNTGMTNQAATIVVNIPDSAVRIRVIYDNTQDSAGAPFRVRTTLTKITVI